MGSSTIHYYMAMMVQLFCISKTYGLHLYVTGPGGIHMIVGTNYNIRRNSYMELFH